MNRTPPPQAIPFIDLATQRDRIREKVDRRMAAVLDHGAYIMGPEIGELETALDAFGQASHTLSCSSGTDALALPLMAWGLRTGDAVFCPSFTFAATAEVVAWLGASPVFVDVERETMNMDAAKLDLAIEAVKREGKLTPRVVIAVDLFGQAADYAAIRAVCDAHGLKLISDAAQGYGATTDGKLSIEWADVVATSFFPAKPLGCYGDGGAIQTNDDELAAIMRSMRVHGQGKDKYDCVRIGMNGRMDTLQAAILLEKLAIFPEEIEARMGIAARYHAKLEGHVIPQKLAEGAISTWAQYTVRLPEPDKREAVQASLREAGVPTAVYYPIPLHRQTAYDRFPVAGGALEETDGLSREVISLPMHPYLSQEVQDHIVGALIEAL